MGIYSWLEYGNLREVGMRTIVLGRYTENRTEPRFLLKTETEPNFFYETDIFGFIFERDFQPDNAEMLVQNNGFNGVKWLEVALQC